MKHNRLESGQSLILIVLAIVGMLGFAALAIDGGRLLAERRRAQSAADSAALAAAFANSESGNHDVTGSATNLLISNGFNPSVETIDIKNPPTSGPYLGDDEYYQVRIHAVVDKVFSQFIFPGTLEYQVEAVAHLWPLGGIAPGMGLVANGEDTCQGIVWDGNTLTTIYHGSIFSNSLGTAAHGGSNCYSGITNGSPGKIYVPDGTIGMRADWNNNAGSTVISQSGSGSSAITVPSPEMKFDFPAVPNCVDIDSATGIDKLPWTTPNNTTHFLPKGKHRSVSLRGNDDWTMESGMHCFYGSFTVGTKSLTALPGQGVFIAMMPAIPGEREGGIAFSGGTTFNLNYMNDYTDASGTQWGGMLIYMPEDNDNGIDIQGNTGTFFSGTILAPGPRTPPSAPKCDIGGANETIGLNSSVICYDIRVHGGTTLNITYDEGANWRNPTKMDLSQ